MKLCTTLEMLCQRRKRKSFLMYMYNVRYFFMFYFLVKQECGSSGVNGGSISHNFGWVGHVDPYSSTYNALLEKRSMPFEEALEEENEVLEYDEEVHAPEIETLPLFPIHAEDINGFTNNFKANYYSGWYCPDDGGRGGSRASLELSLNSYSRRSPDTL